MERETPEFQALNPQQQDARRRLLLSVIATVVESPSSLGISREDTVQFVCDFLEFYLTGRIERLPENTPLKNKRRR